MLFDLDGTLIDSVYQHVLAWHETLDAAGFGLSVWRIHRRIGMSGGLFIKALEREVGRAVGDEEAGRLRAAHVEAYLRRLSDVRPLPGARELLSALTGIGVPWAIATSGSDQTARPALALLGDRARWRNAQRAAVLRVEARYTQRQMIDAYRQVYREAATWPA